MAFRKTICAAITLLTGQSVAQLLLPERAAALLRSGQQSAEQNTPDLEPAPAPNVVGPHDFCGGGPEEQYSGYLGAGPDASYFFWLSKSARQRRAGEPPIPVVFWTSGGPGCSSSLAMLLENGNCRIDGRGSDGWQTHRNPFSWTEEAHVLYVDEPAGVGFSGGRDGMVGNEAGVAERMHEFLVNFFEHFEDLSELPLFITGESFGGHYVPAIAAKIVQENPTARRPMNLQGVAIGNGLVVPVPQFLSGPEMLYTGGEGGSFDGFVDKATYETMVAAEPACRDGLLACEQSKDPDVCVSASNACGMPFMEPILKAELNPYDLRAPCPPELQPMCVNLTYETAFLNDPVVQEAMGVVPGTSWIPCSSGVGAPFMVSGDVFESYGPTVAFLLEHGVRTLVYYGDTDFMCNWVGGKTWAKALDWPHKGAWNEAADEPYVVAGEQRGRVRSVGGFTFLQVWHSGHLVPMNQPEVALAMLRDFISPATVWAVPAAADADLRLSAAQFSSGVAAAAAFALAIALVAGLAAIGARRRRTASPSAEGSYLILD